MNIDKIIKNGLTGEEIGRLFLEDYTDYHFRLGETAKRHKNKEISLKEALNIKGLLNKTEKQKLYDSLKNDKDIKSYNNYMAILKYLDDIAIKMAYFQELTYSSCLRLAYLIAKRKYKETEELEKKATLKLIETIPKAIENIEENYYTYLTIKTSILLIEEITGNNNILNSINYEPDKIKDSELLLNLELETTNEENYKPNSKNNVFYDINLLTKEIPEELVNKARQEVKDLSFFRNREYQLHQILIGGLEDE